MPAARCAHLLRDGLVERTQTVQKLDIDPELVRAGETCFIHTYRSVPSESLIKFSEGRCFPSIRKLDQKGPDSHQPERPGSAPELSLQLTDALLVQRTLALACKGPASCLRRLLAPET